MMRDYNSGQDYPLVSIIMNCYNSSRYLKEAIDSVLAQTYTNWEIVFWDNQSTDESAEIVKSYDDPRIRYIYASQHTRLGKARNLAFEHIKGFWICFLDCDDMWMADKLELQLNVASKNNHVQLIYGVMYTLEQHDDIPELKPSDLYQSNPLFKEYPFHPSGQILPLLLLQNFICISSVMLRAEMFVTVGGINSSYVQAEDFDLLSKVASKSVVEVAGSVVYRIHGSNLSNVQEYERHIECINICKGFLPGKNAIKALKIYNTDLALFQLRNSKVRDGIMTLLKEGSLFRLTHLYILRAKNALARRSF